jgi:hypothetical protein
MSTKLLTLFNLILIFLIYVIADAGIGSNIHPTPARVSDSLPAPG